MDAFGSVHDLIHAAIESNGGAGTLKDIYEVCRNDGRIAYKRAGGSRLITSNDHWKSQIRHALYTGERFQRVPGSGELWQLVSAWAPRPPSLVRVLVRADEAHVNATRTTSRATTNNNKHKQPTSVRGHHHQRKRNSSAITPARCQDDDDDDEDWEDPHFHFETRKSAPAHVARKNTAAKSQKCAVMSHAGSAPAVLATSEFVSPALRPVGRLRNLSDHYTPAPVNALSSLREILDQKDPSDLRWGATGLRSAIIISPEALQGKSPRLQLTRGGATPIVDTSFKPPQSVLKQQPILAPASAVQAAAMLTPGFMPGWAELWKYMSTAAQHVQHQQQQQQQKLNSTPAPFPMPTLPSMVAAGSTFSGPSPLVPKNKNGRSSIDPADEEIAKKPMATLMPAAIAEERAIAQS